MNPLRILCVDDESISLRRTAALCQEINPKNKVYSYTAAKEALEFAQGNLVDVALLDVDMPEINGIFLAELLQKSCPGISIIITTAYREYAYEAYQQNCIAYLLKPFRKEELKSKLDMVTPRSIPGENCLKVCCFGDFSVSYREKPINFKFTKTLELLAYLVDRRCVPVDIHRIISVLWDDDKNHDSYFKSIRKDLKDTLSALPFPVVTSEFGKLGVLREALDCDYLDYYEGKNDTFHGEYMEQFSWAESTKGTLWEIEP